VNALNITEIDHPIGTNPVNNNVTRGRSLQINKNSSRDTSMSSTTSSVVYHERMELNNGMDINTDNPVESPALFYEEEREKESYLGKAAETPNNMRPQGGNNKAFPF